MNGIAHTNILKGAFASLPKGMQAKLTSVVPLLETVGNYPDYFDDPTRPAEEKREIDPDWERFCVYPDELAGKALHFWPCGVTDQAGRRPLMVYLMSRSLESYRAGNLEDFIKFIGCLSHLFGDTTQAAHLGVDISLGFIAQLMPKPDTPDFADFHYHTSIEAVTGECGVLRSPQLLGTSLEESAWRLAQRCSQAVVDCRRFIIPILQALFAGEQKKAEELAGPAVTIAAQLTVDALYTIVLLADDMISSEQREQLAEIDLRLLQADAAFHDLVYGGPVLDGNKDVPPNNAPITPGKLLMPDGSLQAIKGIGVLPHSGMSGPRECRMTYQLPVGVFQCFSALVGMHADLAKDGACDFVVEADGAEIYRSGRMTAQTAAQTIELDISTVKELTLKVEDANDGATFWHNHAFWGCPRLRK
jgi:hypothetical protein